MNDKTRPSSRSLAIYQTPRQLHTTTWVQMARAYAVIERRVVALLSRHEMTLPQFDLLATLRFSEGVTQQELARRLLVTKGNVVGLLDRLETAGWVERRQDPKDARANRLHLTPSGRRKIDGVLPHHDALIDAIVGAITEPDLTTFRRCLDRLESEANKG